MKTIFVHQDNVNDHISCFFQVCVRSLLHLLPLAVVVMVTQLAASSLAATTPFRFPANLAEAFRVESSSQGSSSPKVSP